MTVLFVVIFISKSVPHIIKKYNLFVLNINFHSMQDFLVLG